MRRNAGRECEHLSYGPISDCVQLPNGVKVATRKCLHCHAVKTFEYYTDDPAYQLIPVSAQVWIEESPVKPPLLVYRATSDVGSKRPDTTQPAAGIQQLFQTLRTVEELTIKICAVVGMLAFAAYYVWSHIGGSS